MLQPSVASGDIQYIYQDQQGWAKARLAGAKNSSGQILAFIDDDCIAPSNWLSTYAQSYVTFSDADGIGGGLYPAPNHNLAGMKQYAGHQAYFLRLNAPLNPNLDRASRVWFTFGGNRTFKRDVWLATQADISLWYYDDTAIDHNLRERGAIIYYQPEASVAHYYHLTVMQRLRSAYRYGCSEHKVGHLQFSTPTKTIRERWTQLHAEFPEARLTERFWYALTQPLAWGARRIGRFLAHWEKPEP
jgi:glycosyltransferase involved in cell wall biosynthesis